MALSAREAADALIAEVRALPAQDTSSIRTVRRSRSRAWRNQAADFILETAALLARMPSLRWIAYELVRNHRGAFSSLDDRAIEAFAVGLDSWDSVDAFGRTLSGPAWVQGLAGDGLFDRWAGSPDRWLRRAALVSTVALNRPNEGGRVDASRTLAVCERLVDDRDDMVVKALSWALRELGRQDAAPVRAFLAARRADLPSRVVREVGNKLRTGLKYPRKTANPS